MARYNLLELLQPGIRQESKAFEPKYVKWLALNFSQRFEWKHIIELWYNVSYSSSIVVLSSAERRQERPESP